MNMDHIAKLAGVSKASVSRVLNNKPNVSSALKDKVNAVIEAQNYTPNLIAQALNTNMTKTIGVILPSIGFDVFADIINGIEHVLQQDGFEILLASTEGKQEKSTNYLKIFKMKRVDGIIYFPSLLSEEEIRMINKYEVPLIVIGDYDDLIVPQIAFKDEAAAYDITKLIISKAHSKILYLSTPDNFSVGRNRLKGYLKAMAEYQLEPKVVYSKDLSYQSGYDCMVDKDVTAVFAAMDRLAIGAQRYINDNQLDISIVGIDNMEVANMVSPRLTTVDFDYVRAGEIAGAKLLKLIKKEHVKSEYIDFKIILRDSLGGNDVQ